MAWRISSRRNHRGFELASKGVLKCVAGPLKRTTYWVVDEVNDLHDDSPWIGEVWSFTTLPTTDVLPAMPDGVPCNNTQLMLGNRKGMASCINWQDVGGNYTQSQVASGAQTLSNNWKTWSRGRVQMVGLDGTGTCFTALSWRSR